MFDYALETNIDRMASTHQRWEDEQAAWQDLQEAEEQAIERDPAAVAEALDRLDDWRPLTLLIGKLVSQYQYNGEERAQGLQDVDHEIYDLAYPAIREQAHVNRRRAGRREIVDTTMTDAPDFIDEIKTASSALEILGLLNHLFDQSEMTVLIAALTRVQELAIFGKEKAHERIR